MSQFIKSEQTYNTGECPVGVIKLKGFNPDKIINRIPYHDDIDENSNFYNKIIKLNPEYYAGTPESDPYIQYFNLTYYNSNPQYEIDLLVTEKINKLNEPLFYSYELKFDAYSITESDMLQIYKNNEVEVPKDKYIIQYCAETLHDHYHGAADPLDGRNGQFVTWGKYDSIQEVHRVRVLLPYEFHNPEDFYVIRYSKRLHNITYPDHIELMEIRSLYNSNDFNIDDDKIYYTISTRIPGKGIPNLYVVKNPITQIKIKDILSVNDNGYQSETETSWNIRIQNGSFMTNANAAGSTQSFYNIDYNIGDAAQYQIMSYIKPKIYAGNVLGVDHSPIYIDENVYKYPDYNIDIFPVNTDSNLIDPGTLGFNIDGQLINEIKVSSIDRSKGYLLLNHTFHVPDDIQMFFYTDINYNTYIRNLELNPKVVSKYGMSSSSTVKAFKNIGIAVRKAPSTGFPADPTLYKYPYFFDFDDIGTFYRGSPVPTTIAADEVTGELVWNPYTGESSNTAEFIPIALICLNRLTPDIIEIHDARIIGGGFKDVEKKKFNANQLNSYSDVGYYDGEPLPHAGIIVVHIPRSIYDNLVLRWVNSDMFGPHLYTDVSSYELQEFAGNTEFIEYYVKLLGGISPTDDQVRDPYITMLMKWAIREASHYLDQLIKKYISAGTQYILLDENFNQIKLELES